MTVLLDGESLTLESFELAANGAPVALDASVREKVQASRTVVDELLESGQTLYGINTGFGKLSSERIPREHVNALQRNLILSHCAGVGVPLTREAARGIMVLRLNSLVRGYSGIRLEVLDLMVACLNRGVTPWVPSRGSVGASGDLGPPSPRGRDVDGGGRVSR